MLNILCSKRGGSRRWLSFAGLVILLLILLSLVVWWLWNALMPAIFGLKPIHYGQAMGLLVLARILFGGLQRGFGQRFHRRNHMLQRWERMGPEERDRFRRGLKGHGHHGRRPDEEGADRPE